MEPPNSQAEAEAAIRDTAPSREPTLQDHPSDPNPSPTHAAPNDVATLPATPTVQVRSAHIALIYQSADQALAQLANFMHVAEEKSVMCTLAINVIASFFALGICSCNSLESCSADMIAFQTPLMLQQEVSSNQWCLSMQEVHAASDPADPANPASESRTTASPAVSVSAATAPQGPLLQASASNAAATPPASRLTLPPRAQPATDANRASGTANLAHSASHAAPRQTAGDSANDGDVAAITSAQARAMVCDASWQIC